METSKKNWIYTKKFIKGVTFPTDCFKPVSKSTIVRKVEILEQRKYKNNIYVQVIQVTMKESELNFED